MEGVPRQLTRMRTCTVFAAGLGVCRRAGRATGSGLEVGGSACMALCWGTGALCPGFHLHSVTSHSKNPPHWRVCSSGSLRRPFPRC